MPISPMVLALIAFSVILGTWAVYLAAIPRNTVPARPVASVLLQVLGTAMAVASVVGVLREGRASAALAPAGFALMMGPLFLFLLTQRKTPVGDIKVKVGDTLLPFTSVLSDGSPFDSASLAGQRVLIKFFRGSW